MEVAVTVRLTQSMLFNKGSVWGGQGGVGTEILDKSKGQVPLAKYFSYC